MSFKIDIPILKLEFFVFYYCQLLTRLDSRMARMDELYMK